MIKYATMSSLTEISRLFSRFKSPDLRHKNPQLLLKKQDGRRERAVDSSRPMGHFGWHPADSVLGLAYPTITGEQLEELRNQQGGIYTGTDQSKSRIDDSWLVYPVLKKAILEKSVRYYLEKSDVAVMSKGRFGWTEMMWQFGRDLQINQITLVRYGRKGELQVIFTESSSGKLTGSITYDKAVTLIMPQKGDIIEIEQSGNSVQGQPDGHQPTEASSSTDLAVYSNLFLDSFFTPVPLLQLNQAYYDYLARMNDTRSPFDDNLDAMVLLTNILSANK